MWTYRVCGEKLGTRPNHHFKSHIIHWHGNYNSAEGHCALICSGHCTYVKINSLLATQSANTECEGLRITTQDHLDRKDLRYTLHRSSRAPHNLYFNNIADLNGSNNFKPWLINYITFYWIQHWCLFPAWSQGVPDCQCYCISCLQINPKWDSAEVALDFDSILSMGSSFWFQPWSIFALCRWSNKHKQQWQCRVDIESEVSEKMSISIEWPLTQAKKITDFFFLLSAFEDVKPLWEDYFLFAYPFFILIIKHGQMYRIFQ